MAKTVGALMSMEASGKFASAIIFDKRGYARGYSTPANPQTTGQGDVRQMLAAVQAVLKLLITTAINSIKAAAPTGYRWNSHAVKLAIGTGGAAYLASRTAFAALAAGERTSWNTAFVDVVVPDIAYKAATDVTSGEAGFIVARALFLNSIITAPGSPDGTNFAAWATALVP